MSANRTALANLLAHDIWSVESGSDRQLAKTAHLLASLAEARISARIDAFTTDPALQCAGEAIMAQLASRAKLVELHGRLQDVAGGIGMAEHAGGGGGKPPPGTGEGFAPGDMPVEMRRTEPATGA